MYQYPNDNAGDDFAFNRYCMAIFPYLLGREVGKKLIRPRGNLAKQLNF